MERKEAIEIVRKLYNDSLFLKKDKEAMVTLIPELKESEDERIRKYLIKCVNENMFVKPFNADGFDKFTILAWLEKQGKNNMGISEATKQELENNLNKALEKETPESWNEFLDEQKPVEWSEEDEDWFKEIELMCLNFSNDTDYREKFFTWLKSLKDRVQLQNIAYYNPYKEVVESIAEMCKKYKLPTSNLSDFLDNVKVKCKEAKEFDAMFPQNTWKPSDEQIRRLEYFLKLWGKTEDIENTKVFETVKSLLNDLKKLKE